MGGIFGVVGKTSCVSDLFFGIDYHSHLGTRRGGMAVFSKELGFQRAIHNIENSPFRTKFEKDFEEMEGYIGIGCISDFEPQPMLIRSHLGHYAITTVGRINNEKELVDDIFSKGSHQFLEMSGGRINATELVSMLINEKASFEEGIHWAQQRIKGSMSILIMTENELYAARDLLGRLPVIIGKKHDARSVAFESFAFEKLGYVFEKELGPGEVVRLTPESLETLVPPGDKMRICSFLWTYYGYPNSKYENVRVEMMRYKCGRALAREDMASGITNDLDYAAGIPDSGIAHAVGYANESGVPFARPFIKYTHTWTRSFTPSNQKLRNLVANMKLVPMDDLIRDKKLLFIDDSIVRGTQMSQTVDFLYHNGAKAVHIRSASPAILFGCKYLNFSRSSSEMELISRRVIHEFEGSSGLDHMDEYADYKTERGNSMVCSICKKLRFTSLKYLNINDLIDSIGLPADQICTYCFTGKE